MVISAAARATARIAARSKAGARKVVRKRVVRKRVVKPRVKKVVKPRVKKVVQTGTRKLTQRQMHNRLEDLQDDFISYQHIGDKKGMNRIIKKSEAIEKMPGYKRGYFKGNKFIPYPKHFTLTKVTSTRTDFKPNAKRNTGTSSHIRRVPNHHGPVGPGREPTRGIRVDAAYKSAVPVPPPFRWRIKRAADELQLKEIVKVERRPGALFHGSPTPNTWKGVLTDRESFGLAIPGAVAYSAISWAAISHAHGKTLTGKDLPKPKDKKGGRR